MESWHTLTTADDATLAYRRWHSHTTAPRAPLILIHGAASNLTRWSEFVEQTALRADRDLLRLDLRGHGQSLHRGPINLETWADDLAAILAHERIPRALLAGHCLGANIAATFAIRHPGRAAGVVLIEPMLREALTGSLARLRPFVPVLKVLIAAIRIANRLGIYRRHLEQLDLRSLDRQFRERLARPGGGAALERRYASVLHDLAIMPSANFFQDLVEVIRPLPLARLHAPFLALLSTGRTFADPDITARLLAPLPHGTTQVLDAKHWIPTEQPEAMRAAIENWCRSLAE